MEHRMASYGNRIIGPCSPFSQTNQSFSYPAKKIPNRLALAKIDEKISNLNEKMSTKRYHKEAEIIERLFSIVDSLATERKHIKKKSITPPPEFITSNNNYSEITALLSSFQKQQDMMLQLMVNLNQKKNKKVKKSKSKNKNKDKETSNIIKTYNKLKKDPQSFQKVIAELDIREDDSIDINNYAKSDQVVSLQENISKLKPKFIKKKGKARFRIIGLVVLFPILLISKMIEKKAKFYKESATYMEEKIENYLEIGVDLVMKWIGTVLKSTINDPELDLILSNKDLDVKTQQINSKVIKLQVRVTGIIESLESLANDFNMQKPFKAFLLQYVSNQSFIPMKFLTPFEKSRLDFDAFGGLINQTEDKKRMLLCFFFITRIVIGNILLNPSENGIPIIKGSKTIL